MATSSSSSSSEPRQRSLAKLAAMQLVAGGSAGCVEVSIMHPLDLVKTRFQLQQTTTTTSASKVETSHHYASVVDCMRKMYRSEGVLSFWKGILPPILVETPKRAWKFFTFEQFKGVAKFHQDQPQALTFSLAGLGSGVTEAILVNPFEVVKVKMQSNRAHQSMAPSTNAVVKEILKEEGLASLLGKGITSTMGRNGFFNMFYFGFYHTVKEYLPAPSPTGEDAVTNFVYKFAIGLTAGTLASCINIPFDVAKSRIQGPQPKNVPKYCGAFATIARVQREEGTRALYKGLVPKIMRLGPGGAIMLLVYEYVYAYLQDRFPD